MSEEVFAAETPQPVYLSDYQAPTFLIDNIHLVFNLYDDRTVVNSEMRILRNANAVKTKDLILNGIGLALQVVKINGRVLTEAEFRTTENTLILFNVPDEFTCEISTHLFPHLNTALSGLYLSNGTYCTQCEAEGFRRITYFLDRPDVLACYTTKIIADKKRYPVLLSNGNLIAQGELDNDRHWVIWQDPFKKPSYLFALVAGDFDLLEDTFLTQSQREVVLKIYVEKGYGQQAQHAMFSLKAAMRWDEKAFGREYDLNNYLIVAISDFNMGAMENKGLNIFNTKYILAKPETATDDDYINILSVIGHEYFHNWTGNRVTCRDWFQLSLKEGLTIFRDQSFSEDMLSKAFIRIREVNSLREIQFIEDAGPLAHPVRPESYIEINNFYTATVYNKGAEVLRMLQTILGKTVFRAGMDLYFEIYDGQAVTIEDFVKTMETASRMDLTQFRLWYEQAGTPVVTVQDDYDEKKQIYRLNINQYLPETPGQSQKKSLHIPIKMGLLSRNGDSLVMNKNGETECVCHLTKSSQIFTFENIPERPIPSLLRHFSAPVKLQYQYADEELIVLCLQDTDAFNRYEAGQRYALRILLGLIQDYQREKSIIVPPAFIALFANLLEHHTKDPALLAEMLTLPSEKYIGEQLTVVDVEAIHIAREKMLSTLAAALKDKWLAMYKYLQSQTETTDFGMHTIGLRQLKNRCLSYLMLLSEHESLGINQFEQALGQNMSDTQAALTALANRDTPARNKALQMFYDLWQADALVVDKWLAIQAMSKLPETLNEVKKLMRHPAFDLKNPNKVYALIGTFGMRNPIAFHQANGEGYAFLREVVSQLDKINPQVAGRMVNPLTQWRRYGKERQVLMRQQLESLIQEGNLSNDLYELVTKSLLN